ncbi:hypothetical protein NDU88_007681 [Pleurodeles waltl]|uniref:CCHC-type domain-containing protein n=1 Tax=Pleurodeles waltl TaxID=8319 RepID=A0AAV7VQF5_PLEWA|nr:hypothetical protein NDU88_007681 [Pleurodeles waltl]
MKEIEVTRSYLKDSGNETTVEVKEVKSKRQEWMPENAGVKAGEKKNMNILCFRCGCPGHIASSPNCAAPTLTCRSCGRRGHIAKVCRSKGKVISSSIKSVDDMKDEHHEIVLSVDEVGESDQLVVESISKENWKRESSSKLEKPHCSVTIDSMVVKVLVDSGSLFTLISRETYEKILGKKCEDLLKTDVKGVGHGGKRIEILGMQWMDILFKGNGIHGKVYVTGEGSNLLGWRHQKDLNIIFDPNATETVMVVERMANVEDLKSNEQWCEMLMAKFSKVFTDKSEFVRGRRNVVADCLSRVPNNGGVDEMCEMELEAFSIDGELALGEDEWEEAVRIDVEYDELRGFII